MQMHGDDVLKMFPEIQAPTVAAIIRHAERYPIVDPSRPTEAEITPSGAEAARRFGERLEGFDKLRLFHSPVKRCRQTAECIAEGASQTGISIEVSGPREALGVDYILDLVEAGRLTAEHGDHFVRLWFDGKMPESIIWPTSRLAAEKLEFLRRCASDDTGNGRRLDLHVSHDWNIIVLREYLLGLRHEETGWLDFLDGLCLGLCADGLRAYCRGRSTLCPRTGETRA